MMNTIVGYVKEITWDKIIFTSIKILLIFVVSWIAMLALLKLIQALQDRLLKKTSIAGEPPSESEKRVQTLVRLIKQASLILLWVTVGLIVLKELGVNIAPILASAGVLGLAVGFGAQNLVRDVISGFFIILENQIRVGDVAILNGTGGLVESVNFRTIVLRDLSGVIHVFPNGTITSLSNMTYDWSAYVFDIGIAYKENTDKVIEVLKEVGESMKKDQEFGPAMLDVPEIFGVDKFDDSAVVIKGRLKTKPIQQWKIGREFLRRVKYAFDAKGIEIPFPHRTIYFGEVSPPFDIRLMEQNKLQNPS